MNKTPDAIDEEHSRGHHDVHEDSKSAAHIRLDRLGHIKGGDERERAAGQSYKEGSFHDHETTHPLNCKFLSSCVSVSVAKFFSLWQLGSGSISPPDNGIARTFSKTLRFG